MSPQFLRLTPIDVGDAALSFLGRYRKNGRDELAFLRADITVMDRPAGADTLDAAMWGDWLESVWSTRGILATHGMNDWVDVVVRDATGSTASANVIGLEPTAYVAHGDHFELGNPNAGIGSFSESAAFTIVAALASWSGLPEATTVAALMDTLMDIKAGTANRVVMSAWRGLLT